MKLEMVRWVAIKKMDQRGDPRQNEVQSINMMNIILI